MALSTHYDVIVVGAGPAGGVAAYHLAAAGARVLLLEKEKLPRYKACGGGVVPRALAALPFPLEGGPGIVERLVSRFHLSLNHQRPFTVERSQPVVRMTMRSTLDEYIARQAVAAGATLAEGVTVKALEDSPRRVLIETSAGLLTSDFLIGADGANSIVARSQLEFLPPRCGVALEAEVHLKNDNLLADYAARADFDFNVLQRGYGWVFPKADHLSVGVFTLNSHFQKIKLSYQAYAERKGLRENVARTSLKGHLIPLGPPTRTLNTRRMLLAGDAAGLADPLTGEGISYAVRSGGLAAEAVSAALRSGDRLDSYTERVRAGLLPEIRAGALLARILYTFPHFVYGRFTRDERFAHRFIDVFEEKATYGQLLWEGLLKPHRLLGY
jgi:geranylgeranyl reductase family protein